MNSATPQDNEFYVDMDRLSWSWEQVAWAIRLSDLIDLPAAFSAELSLVLALVRWLKDLPPEDALRVARRYEKNGYLRRVDGPTPMWVAAMREIAS